MNGSQTFLPLTREALEQHDQILFHLERLEAALAGLDAEGAGSERFAEIAVRIDSLKERIEEHFRHEDSGGLFQALVDQLPETEQNVHELMEEHDRLTETLEMISIRSRRGESSEAGILRSEIEGLIRDVRGHEARETALLRRALDHGDRTAR